MDFPDLKKIFLVVENLLDPGKGVCFVGFFFLFKSVFLLYGLNGVTADAVSEMSGQC